MVGRSAGIHCFRTDVSMGSNHRERWVTDKIGLESSSLVTVLKTVRLVGTCVQVRCEVRNLCIATYELIEGCKFSRKRKW